MKMKRMEMRDVSIGEYQFKIRPFGAKDALYIFGDVASILLPILGSVAVASDDKDAVEMEMFDGVDLDTESLTKALGRINGKALSKLVSELIIETRTEGLISLSLRMSSMRFSASTLQECSRFALRLSN